MKKFVLLCTTAVLPTAAFAQSTGTATFEKDTIVVTGNRIQNVGGVKITDTTKPRGVLTQEFIERQQPGQSINDMINYLPGVSFQSNGPYGDAGGTLTVHGFSGDRVSETFDGVPMNDSGNYKLYSQEQLDPELVSEVNVSAGSSDIDSPTASASGGAVNYVLRDPMKQMHVRMQGTLGSFGFKRFFGSFDTGPMTQWGTRAFVAASSQRDYNPYDPTSRIHKQQYNAKVLQPLGGTDFISANAFWNINRGQHFNDLTLDKFPSSSTASVLTPPLCTTAGTFTKPNKNTADPNCGLASKGYYGYFFGPSDHFRLHMNSRFTVAQNLILTLEPNYEYTEANGGGGVIATEGNFLLGAAKTPLTGFIGGKPYFGGVDLNGDGDTADTVTVDAPSNTVTHRYGLIGNLIYHFSDTQQVRLNYSYDHAKLRQTGEVAPIMADGRPIYYFPERAGALIDATGARIEKRNRLSYSILNQVAAQYRGRFMEDRLVVDLGARMPFFSRKLTNYCVAESGGSGFVDCFNDPKSQAAFLAFHANDASGPYQAPQSRNRKFKKLLPSAGLSYRFAPDMQFFANYSEGLQVPSTDTLYDAFAFPVGAPGSTPKPETSRNIESGVRYNTRKVKAQISAWHTAFHNRIEESLLADPNDASLFRSVYTNLGDVTKYGFDANVAYAPDRHLTLYAFGSLIHSKIKDDVVGGKCGANDVKFSNPAGGTDFCTVVGQPIIFRTAGKQESGAPQYLFGGRAQANLGAFTLGVQAKRTGPRFVNDQNTPVLQFPTQPSKPPYVVNTALFPAKAPAYTVVDLDARVSLESVGFGKGSFFQFNVHNLFNKFYVSGFDGTVDNSARKAAFVYVGAPRAVTGSLNLEF